MPRQAREKCENGIYHVMLRGVNRQQIFEEEQDFARFLQILAECKLISGFELYAYCLMGNHLHLLLKVQKEPLELLVKRIATRYVYWYNTKYERSGHLFQDRFRSEPVKDRRYFLTVLCYIHQNPIKAGICKDLDQYVYSSYREYKGESVLIDREFVYSLISPDDLLQLLNRPIQENCLDVNDQITARRVTDEQARQMIEKHTKCKNVSDFEHLDVATRNKYLKLLKQQGLSIRQISRLTGISFGIISRI